MADQSGMCNGCLPSITRDGKLALGSIGTCVFRTIVTARFGIVTAEFGNVTDRFGDVTDGVLIAA